MRRNPMSCSSVQSRIGLVISSKPPALDAAETVHAPGRAQLLVLDLLDKLRRVYTLAKRVAKEFVPKAVASEAA